MSLPVDVDNKLTIMNFKPIASAKQQQIANQITNRRLQLTEHDTQ